MKTVRVNRLSRRYSSAVVAVAFVISRQRLICEAKSVPFTKKTLARVKKLAPAR